MVSAINPIILSNYLLQFLQLRGLPVVAGVNGGMPSPAPGATPSQVLKITEIIDYAKAEPAFVDNWNARTSAMASQSAAIASATLPLIQHAANPTAATLAAVQAIHRKVLLTQDDAQAALDKLPG